MDAPSCSSTCSCTSFPPRRDDKPDLPPPCDGPQLRSTFHVPGMDCPSEEQMIRLRLASLPVGALHFDLPARTLAVDHAGEATAILRALEPLGFGATLTGSTPLTEATISADQADPAAEARVLWLLLAINALMFVVEIGAGWLARSAGLIADAMDMFADAAVYGVALYAVGRAVGMKLTAARMAGVLQLILALGALTETARHILARAEPESVAMIGIAALALIANASCLLLIHRHRHRGAHMHASYIFSANDVIANAGVIVAGLLVSATASPWPDWIIGAIIGGVILAGSIRILRLR
ncbi:cation transporter [Aromatoleum petrolei]|uniref:Cation efflux protein transmembrane domain-containing protein n=1 Tax=Aromatoleum petrolei TaxID=76116 RepID=A0ABX1MMA9_9RHOO|nr:cation transporter [Aromatoleum petrolei]NMF89090.1 hypothetical protein [Aromatoleum petrolei]QTQ38318.1 Cation efflux family protein [Aromatoleum petrolei]